MEQMLYRFDYMRLCQRQITAMHHFFDFDLVEVEKGIIFGYCKGGCMSKQDGGK